MVGGHGTGLMVGETTVWGTMVGGTMVVGVRLAGMVWGTMVEGTMTAMTGGLWLGTMVDGYGRGGIDKGHICGPWMWLV